jgi:hypothetical protein
MRAPAARAITLTIHRAIRGATRGATWRGYLAGLRGGYLWGCAGEPIFRCACNKSTSAKPLQTNGAYMPIRSLLTRAPLLTRVAPCRNCPTPRLAVVSAGLQTAAPGSPVSTPVLPMGSHGGAYACQGAQESTAQPSTKVSPPPTDSCNRRRDEPPPGSHQVSPWRYPGTHGAPRGEPMGAYG